MLGRVFVAMMLVTACGGKDDGGDGSGVDAPAGVDAAVATVVVVDPCPATPDAEVTTDDATFAYMPKDTTIAQGQVVRFVTSSTHDVNPATNKPSDPGLKVGFNKMTCLRFTATGTFNFFCGPHGFSGSITVN
jgi:plastocyanin